MLTYRELVEGAAQTLYESSNTPRIDAEYLIQHVTGKPLSWLIAYGDSQATKSHTIAFTELVDRRATGTPVAYLMGYRDFWTLRLKVSSAVLIPRGDTEVLVEQALARLPKNESSNILDLGTGSGAIALSIAKERQNALVLGIDLHADALAVAKENAKLNEIDNVNFKQSDWFVGVGSQRFSMIVSNPPYVEHGDAHLQQGDLRFEPIAALAADDDGLADIKQIVSAAPNYLRPDGWVLIEHGHQQADAVASLLSAAKFKNIALYADLNHLPRCTAAQWRAS